MKIQLRWELNPSRNVSWKHGSHVQLQDLMPYKLLLLFSVQLTAGFNWANWKIMAIDCAFWSMLISLYMRPAISELNWNFHYWLLHDIIFAKKWSFHLKKITEHWVTQFCYTYLVIALLNHGKFLGNRTLQRQYSRSFSHFQDLAIFPESGIPLAGDPTTWDTRFQHK